MALLPRKTLYHRIRGWFSFTVRSPVKHKKKRTPVAKILWAIVGLFCLVVVFLVVLFFINSRKDFIYGLTINETSVHQLSEQQVLEVLQHQTEEILNKKIQIHTSDSTRDTTLSATGVLVDISATINNAKQEGRTGGIFDKLYAQVKSVFGQTSYPLVVSFDEIQFRTFKESALTGLFEYAHNAEARYDLHRRTFNITPSVEGIAIDDATLKQDINHRVQTLSINPITLYRHADVPTEISDMKRMEEYALSVMPPSMTLLLPDKAPIKVSRYEIAGWYVFFEDDDGTFSYKYSPKTIRRYLLKLTKLHNQEPKNARFTLDRGQPTIIEADVNGYDIMVDQGVQALQNALDKEYISIELPIKVVQAEIHPYNIEELGFTLLGIGETYFSGSPTNRRHNILVGAERYQGILLSAGEEFSFNDNLGEVSAEAGYLPDYIIRNNVTTKGYGGGLCQVSTTLFRAVIYAGLDVTARQHHSYVVPYYGTPGFDATIYSPYPDLRFKNTTSGYVLIQYRVEGEKLIFEIYGKDEGKMVFVDGPFLYDQQPNGAVKTYLTQRVTQNNVTIHEETFHSNYRSKDDYPVETNPLI